MKLYVLVKTAVEATHRDVREASPTKASGDTVWMGLPPRKLKNEKHIPTRWHVTNRQTDLHVELRVPGILVPWGRKCVSHLPYRIKRIIKKHYVCDYVPMDNRRAEFEFNSIKTCKDTQLSISSSTTVVTMKFDRGHRNWFEMSNGSYHQTKFETNSTQ